MNVRHHFLERYCERVLKMEGKKSIRQYVARNRGILIQHSLRLFSHAIFIYQGVIGENTASRFYIRNDNIIVTDTKKTSLITMYKCDLGLEEEENKRMIKELLNELLVLKEYINNKDSEKNVDLTTATERYREIAKILCNPIEYRDKQNII